MHVEWSARWYQKLGVAHLHPYCLNPKPKLRPSVSPKPQDKGCGSLLGVWNGMQHCFSTARPNPTSPPRLRHSPMAASSRCPTATKQADASPRRSRDPILSALPGRASRSQRQSSSKSITNGRRNGVSGHISAEMGRDITPADCPYGLAAATDVNGRSGKSWFSRHCHLLFVYFSSFSGLRSVAGRFSFSFSDSSDNNTTIMFQAIPLKRSLSRSVIRIIQRTLPLVKRRRRSWTTHAKKRMPIDM